MRLAGRYQPVAEGPLCRRSLAGRKYGVTEPSAVQDAGSDEDRSVRRRNVDDGHISPRHGLLRGAGADRLAHREARIVAVDVEQVALVHGLAPAQQDLSHAATIEAVVGKGAFDDPGAQLEGPPGEERREPRPMDRVGQTRAGLRQPRQPIRDSRLSRFRPPKKAGLTGHLPTAISFPSVV